MMRVDLVYRFIVIEMLYYLWIIVRIKFFIENIEFFEN